MSTRPPVFFDMPIGYTVNEKGAKEAQDGEFQETANNGYVVLHHRWAKTTSIHNFQMQDHTGRQKVPQERCRACLQERLDVQRFGGRLSKNSLKTPSRGYIVHAVTSSPRLLPRPPD